MQQASDLRCKSTTLTQSATSSLGVSHISASLCYKTCSVRSCHASSSGNWHGLTRFLRDSESTCNEEHLHPQPRRVVPFAPPSHLSDSVLHLVDTSLGHGDDDLGAVLSGAFFVPVPQKRRRPSCRVLMN